MWKGDLGNSDNVVGSIFIVDVLVRMVHQRKSAISFLDQKGASRCHEKLRNGSATKSKLKNDKRIERETVSAKAGKCRFKRGGILVGRYLKKCRYRSDIRRRR